MTGLSKFLYNITMNCPQNNLILITVRNGFTSVRLMELCSKMYSCACADNSLHRIFILNFIDLFKSYKTSIELAPQRFFSVLLREAAK